MKNSERGHIVTEKILEKRIGSGKYGVSKWIQFCRYMMERGYKVKLYEAHKTVSKYVTVIATNDVSYTVRFSNHKPNRGRELNGDCDFFCGVTWTGTRTISEAIHECLKALGGLDGVAGEGDRSEVGTLVKKEQNKMEEKIIRGTARSMDFAGGWTPVDFGTEAPRGIS